ncbi:uncharacterized protein VNE69_03202 [Vairimorpha necatrix]|uniref:Uncharacterized protein n=1 Tax=Vairimorpha necatrix TaxID=6039 RepID=A0AAX4JAG9_9MICR
MILFITLLNCSISIINNSNTHMLQEFDKKPNHGLFDFESIMAEGINETLEIENVEDIFEFYKNYKTILADDSNLKENNEITKEKNTDNYLLNGEKFEQDRSSLRINDGTVFENVNRLENKSMSIFYVNNFDKYRNAIYDSNQQMTSGVVNKNETNNIHDNVSLNNHFTNLKRIFKTIEKKAENYLLYIPTKKIQINNIRKYYTKIEAKRRRIRQKNCWCRESIIDKIKWILSILKNPAISDQELFVDALNFTLDICKFMMPNQGNYTSETFSLQLKYLCYLSIWKIKTVTQTINIPEFIGRIHVHFISKVQTNDYNVNHIITKKIVENNAQILQNITNEIKKYLYACENRIKTFITVMELKSISKREIGVHIEKYKKVEDHINKHYKEITRIKNNFLYQLTLLTFPQIKREIENSDAPTEIKYIFFEFIKLFEFFLTVYNMKIKMNGYILNKHRIDIHNYNIEIFSLFKYIPIIETLEIMNNKLRLYDYKNTFIKQRVINVYWLIKHKLVLLSNRSDIAKEIYEKLNQIYNNK